MNRYIGRVSMVTGGTSGIGLGIAKKFASEGSKVIVVSIDKNLQETISSLNSINQNVEGFYCDVTQGKERQEIFDFVEKKYGRLDVLVLNAGVMTGFGKQMEFTEEQFDRIFDVNLKSYFFMAQKFLPLLQKSQNDFGNILMTSSVVHKHRAPLAGVYSMTKAGISNMAQWLAVELREYHIRVNAIAPGTTRSEMTRFIFESDLIKSFPWNSVGEPEDIAELAALICSKQGRYMNGETYDLHGGSPLGQ